MKDGDKGWRWRMDFRDGVILDDLSGQDNPIRKKFKNTYHSNHVTFITVSSTLCSVLSMTNVPWCVNYVRN